MQTSTPTLAKVRVGFFLKEIVDHCLSKVTGTLSPDRSIYVYTTHDAVLTNFLNGLGIFDVNYLATLFYDVFQI